MLYPPSHSFLVYFLPCLENLAFLLPRMQNSRRVSPAELPCPMPKTTFEEVQTRKNPTKDSSLFQGLNRAHLAVVALLTVSNLFSTISFSCIVPFFPPEAIKHKELSTSQVGMVIGWFPLISFFVCPLIGKNMARLGANRVFSGGILLSGLTTIVFGLANWLPSGTPFFAACLLIRTAQAVGSGAFTCSSWAIVGRLFPAKIGLFMAINEVAYGLGSTLGPPLGSALYESGGYLLPMLVVGSVQMFLMLLSLPLHWGPLAEGTDEVNKSQLQHQQQEQSTPGIFQLFFIPDIFMQLFSLFTLCIAWCFYEPDLANHLSTFPGWRISVLVGFMLTLLSGTYMVSAPISGYLLDRFLAKRTTLLPVVGGLLIVVQTLLVGPTPLLPFLPKSLPLIGFSFVLLGIAGAILYIPVFKWCVEAAKKRGFDGESPAVCGLISGFFQSTVSLGSFLAISLGGFSSEKIGLAWTATGVAVIEIFQISMQLLYHFVKNRRQKQQEIRGQANDKFMKI